MPASSARRRLIAAGLAASTVLGGAFAVAAPASAATGGAGRLPDAAGHQHSKPALLSSGEAKAKVAAVKGLARQAFLLKLSTASTGSRFATVESSGGLKAAKSAAKSQLSVVKAAQNRVIGALPANSKVVYRAHAAVAGVAVITSADKAGELAEIPGVTAVYPITPKTRDTSYAVPFQGGPTAWAGDGSGQNLGKGVVIADLDTGFDYTHADFGGPGTEAAYETAHAADTVAPASGTYDPKKFLAGLSTDLVGDDYNADTTGQSGPPQVVPHADPNPLDCSPEYGGEGHGSHTAGIAAGYGVAADGSTYAGPYDDTAPFDTMKIGPGMAPEASVMALRVFGCVGSTDVVSQAIDTAMDPNGDGDTSDHADVINMSLGSDFGAPDDGDAVVANQAADLGITVAISMGNAYDVYDVGGSPGAATDAITVASSVDAQSVVDGLNVSFDGAAQDPMAAERSVVYPWADQPDLSGEVAIPADDPTGCGTFDDADKALIAGKIALLTWHDADPTANGGCGSAARGANVRAAGGTGFIFASDSETFSAGITGDTGIPGVLVAKSGGDAITAAIGAGQTVTVSGTTVSSVKQTFADDNDSVSDFSSRGLRGNGDLKPDVAAVGNTVFSVLPGSGSDGQNMSGTSMAAPMVAGLAALVKGKHPDWTPAEVKADIMNTANHDLYVDGSAAPDSGKYAPMRVGSGRIDAGQALANDVTAAVTDDPGSVSASWGSFTFDGNGTSPVTRTKTIKVHNTGLATHTYDVSLDPATEIPGVTYTVSPQTVTVGARGSASVTVTLSVAPAEWQKTFDATKGDADAATGLPEGTIAESSGNVVLEPQDDSPSLRVPYYAAPKPVSTMSAPSNLALSNAGAGTLTLTGKGYATPEDPNDAHPVFSLAEGLELTATSGAAPKCSAKVTTLCLTNDSDKAADLKYVGYTSDVNQPTASQGDFGEPTLLFGITGQAAHTTAGDKPTYVVYLDTDNDGVTDYYTINTHLGSNDVLVAETFDARTDENVDIQPINRYLGEIDTNYYDSDSLVIPVGLDELNDAGAGLSTSHPTVHYAIDAIGVQGTLVDKAGYTRLGADGYPVPTLVANAYNPGIEIGGATGTGEDGWGTVDDQAGMKLSVQRNAAAYTKEGGRGVLLLHLHNAAGKQAQVVSLKATSRPTLTVAPASVGKGGRVTATATVPTAGGIAPTGKVTFRSGSRTLGSATLRSGRATLAITAGTLGRNSLTASYAGDGNYRAASSAAATFTVTTVSKPRVTATPKQVKKGKRVKVVVTVPKVGGLTPTGRVTLKVAGKWAGAKALSGGKATFSVKMTKKGTFRIVAAYAGNGIYKAASSAPVKITVHR